MVTKKKNKIKFTISYGKTRKLNTELNQIETNNAITTNRSGVFNIKFNGRNGAEWRVLFIRA